jgi:hypothetical protein
MIGEEKLNQLVRDSAKMSSQLAEIMDYGIRATAPDALRRYGQVALLRETLMDFKKAADDYFAEYRELL